MIPILIILAVAVLNFFYAKKWGIVSMTSGSLGVLAGLSMFFMAVNYSPGLVSDKFDDFSIEIPWSILLTISAVLGVITFFIVWAISRAILKVVFQESSIFHQAGRGISGGILSLFATAVVAILILVTTRIAGTAMELNYVHKMASTAIVDLVEEDYPKPSPVIKWRNEIEKVPKIADWLDLCDPFSRIENRNFGIVTIFASQDPARDFSRSSSQMASILSNGRVRDWLESEDVKNMLNLENDRVALVLGEEAMEVAAHRDLRSRLRDIDIDQHIKDYSKYLQNLDVPTAPPENETSSSGTTIY